MIYDSPEQRDFIFKILRGYQCSYAESLVISQTHAPAIQSGMVIPVEKQQGLVDEVYPKAKAGDAAGVTPQDE